MVVTDTSASSNVEEDSHDGGALAAIVVQATARGLPPVTIRIPITDDEGLLPLAVASATVAQ